jgi:hypothetical protein
LVKYLRYTSHRSNNKTVQLSSAVLNIGARHAEKNEPAARLPPKELAQKTTDIPGTFRPAGSKLEHSTAQMRLVAGSLADQDSASAGMEMEK